MKIVGTQIQQIMSAYRARSGKAENVTGPSGPADEVHLSERASEVLKARQAFDALPDVREARIAALRERIQGGTYQLDDMRIARALMAGDSPTDDGSSFDA